MNLLGDAVISNASYHLRSILSVLLYLMHNEVDLTDALMGQTRDDF